MYVYPTCIETNRQVLVLDISDSLDTSDISD